jgi:hypothetical protein
MSNNFESSTQHNTSPLIANSFYQNKLASFCSTPSSAFFTHPLCYRPTVYCSSTENYLDCSTISDDAENQDPNKKSYLNSKNDNNNALNRFFSDSVVEVLNRWFVKNEHYPYPDEQTTRELARDANISAKQVRKWFANKRVRSNKCIKQSYRKKSTPINSYSSDSNNQSDELDISGTNETSSPQVASNTNLIIQQAYLQMIQNLMLKNLQPNNKRIVNDSLISENSLISMSPSASELGDETSIQNASSSEHTSSRQNGLKAKTNFKNILDLIN